MITRVIWHIWILWSYGWQLWQTATNYFKKNKCYACTNVTVEIEDIFENPAIIYKIQHAKNWPDICCSELQQCVQKNQARALTTNKPASYAIRNRPNYGRQTGSYNTTKILIIMDANIDYSNSFISFKSDCRRYLVTNMSTFSLV